MDMPLQVCARLRRRVVTARSVSWVAVISAMQSPLSITLDAPIRVSVSGRPSHGLAEQTIEKNAP